METITSRSNEYLKYVRRVRDGRIEGKFFVEGKRLTGELPNSDVAVESLLFSTGLFPDPEKASAAFGKHQFSVRLLAPGLFQTISHTKSPQGIAAVCLVPENGMRRLEKNVGEEDKSIILLLQNVSNPGNLGSVIRTGEATGVAGVIVSRASANPFSPAAVRGSMGSVFRVPVWAGVDIDSAVAWAKEKGFTVLGTDSKADLTITETDWKRDLLLVFGSEAHGLEDHSRGLLDETVRIPMKETVESLNLAVAAGVVLFEAAKSR